MSVNFFVASHRGSLKLHGLRIRFEAAGCDASCLSFVLGLFDSEYTVTFVICTMMLLLRILIADTNRMSLD